MKERRCRDCVWDDGCLDGDANVKGLCPFYKRLWYKFGRAK